MIKAYNILKTLFVRNRSRSWHPAYKLINKVLKEHLGTDDFGKPLVYVNGYFERNDAWLFDLHRSSGVKLGKVLSLQDEMLEEFSHINAEIEVSIDARPLRVTIYKEVPETVYLNNYIRDIALQAKRNNMESCPGVAYVGKEMELFGLSFKNESFCHILITGSTGAGKTVLVKSLLLTLAGLNSPEMCSIVICDKKGGLDFSDIQDLPHVPNRKCVVKDSDIKQTIKTIHTELMRRIDNQDTESMGKHIVLVIDEFHQMMDNDKSISQLKDITAMGRAWGIHLIAITQRADFKSIDTTLRSNLVAEFAGKMTKKGAKGIESGDDADLQSKIPGKGLFLARSATADNKRVQGFWLSDDDIQRHVNSINREFANVESHFQLEQPDPNTTHNTQHPPQPDDLPRYIKDKEELIEQAQTLIDEGVDVTANMICNMYKELYSKTLNYDTANKVLEYLTT